MAVRLRTAFIGGFLDGPRRRVDPEPGGVAEVAEGRAQLVLVINRKDLVMLKLFLAFRALLADNRGVTAIEYAVLGGAVAVGLAIVFGSDQEIFTAVTDSITQALDESPAGGE